MRERHYIPQEVLLKLKCEIYPCCYDRIVSPPPQTHVKALTPSVTGFGDGALGKVIQVKWGHGVGDLTQEGRCPCKQRTTSPSFSMHTQRKGQVRTQWGVATHRPGRAPSPATEFADTLIMDFQPLALWENKYLPFKPLGLCDFVRTTQKPRTPGGTNFKIPGNQWKSKALIFLIKWKWSQLW